MPGRAVRLGSDSGYFWFFDPTNPEIFVKVLDACVAPFERYWVFAAGLTDVETRLTVVDSATWKDSALSYYWMGAIDYLRRLHHKERLYWFLIVSGYRTYRFLPVYSKTFFPRHDCETPSDVQAIMDTVASARFGDNYDAATGIVRLDHPALLKGRFRGIPDNRMQDPHIAFFARRNPGHEAGDELVCFAILAEDELTRLGRRMWQKGRKLFPDVEPA